MKRRIFLTAALLVAIGRPSSVRGQDSRRERRIGVLMNLLEKDPLGEARKAALVEGLKDLGWVEGRNLRVDVRWGGNDLARYRKYAEELIAASPDVIVCGGTQVVRVLQQATKTIPIIFATATDPVGGGLVASLARPGGNITGLTQREFGLGAKSLELLKQIAPRVTRVAVVRDSTTTGGVGQFGAIQAAAPSFKVEPTPIDVRSPAEIERDIGSFARGPNGGIIAATGTAVQLQRKLIIRLANEHRLPAVYPYGYFVNEGGLAAYGIDTVDSYRRAAGYVDRILKGERPGNLPVQQPTKFELLINLRTARAMGLTIPQSVLLRADKVIE